MRQTNPSRREWLSGGSWLAHRLEMLESPAWQARTRPLAKVLERLEIEHCRHAGKENGRLCVSYTQFVDYGISKKVIRATLDLGQHLGLLEVIQLVEWIGDIKPENMYRVTYLPAKDKRAPTDEWKHVTHAAATLRLAECRRRLKRDDEELSIGRRVVA